MAEESKEFSITLPMEAIEMIEEDLIPYGLYGKYRGTICRNLILDMLKQLAAQQIVRKPGTKK
jgi:hypothetical protein